MVNASLLGIWAGNPFRWSMLLNYDDKGTICMLGQSWSTVKVLSRRHKAFSNHQDAEMSSHQNEVSMAN